MLAHATIIGLAAATVAAATPSAAADGPCAGQPPAVGHRVRGPVLHVLDGLTLCVALGPSPEMWVPLELAAPRRPSKTGQAPPQRGTLMAAAFARNAACRVVDVRAGRSIAMCRVDGRRISDRLHDPAVIAAGPLWR